MTPSSRRLAVPGHQGWMHFSVWGIRMRSWIPQPARSVMSISCPAAWSGDGTLANGSLSCSTALTTHQPLRKHHYPKSSTWSQEARLNLREALTLMCESSELTAELSQQLWLSTGHLCFCKSTQQIPEPLAGAEGVWLQDVLYLPLYGPKLSATPAASPQHCSQAWTECCGCSWKLLPVRHKPINAAVCSAAPLTVLAFGNQSVSSSLAMTSGLVFPKYVRMSYLKGGCMSLKSSWRKR